MILASGRFFLMIGMRAVTVEYIKPKTKCKATGRTLWIVDHDYASIKSSIAPKTLI